MATTTASPLSPPEESKDDHSPRRGLLNPLIAGAVAGLSVDVLLFPVDTIKTRLQSPRGFLRSGGFKRLYAGLGSTVSGSAPGAALFFFTYETAKKVLASSTSSSASPHQSSGCHLVSACLGETVACLVRVPVEVVKQRAQAYNSNSLAVLRQVLAQSGPRGLYRGYTSTLIREIPFSLVQFPLWEYLKRVVSEKSRGERTNSYSPSSSPPPPLKPYQSMACGSAAGAVAAFLTTPLDVAKTTIMLSSGVQQEPEPGKTRRTQHTSEYRRVLVDIYSQKGVRGLFAGALPRVAWISVGGAIFLGGYDIVSGCL